MAPAQRLKAVLFEDAGFAQTGTAIVMSDTFGGVSVGRARARASLLREAGRYTEEKSHLTHMLTSGLKSIDVLYRLGLLAIAEDRLNDATQFFDDIVRFRPALWNYTFELIDALTRSGKHKAAQVRLEALKRLVPKDSGVGRRLVNNYLIFGDTSRARKIVQD